MKLDVGVPQRVLGMLFNTGAKLIKMEDDAYEQKNKNDPKLDEVYCILISKVDNFVYNTSSTYTSTNKEILELQDEYADLIGGGQHTQSTNMDEQK